MSERLKQHNGGFTTPPNYFNQLKQQLTDEVKITPNAHIKTNGFSVPNGYFLQLNKRIKQKTIAASAHKDSHMWQQYAAAAAIVLVAVFLFLFEPTLTSNTQEQLTDEAIINHLQNEDITIDLLCDAGWCNDLNLNNSNLIEEYLLNETDAYEWYN